MGSNFNSTVPTTKKKVPPSTDVEFELVLISVSSAPKDKSEKDDKDDDAEENDEIEDKTGGEQFVSNPHRTAHFKKKMNKAEIKAAYRVDWVCHAGKHTLSATLVISTM